MSAKYVNGFSVAISEIVRITAMELTPHPTMPNGIDVVGEFAMTWENFGSLLDTCNRLRTEHQAKLDEASGKDGG